MQNILWACRLKRHLAAAKGLLLVEAPVWGLVGGWEEI